MKKSTLFFGLVLGIIVFARMVAADEKKISDYKTAQECYDAAMKIVSAGIAPADQMKVWGRKFALLGQAIALDPKFTQAYIPYVQTYFEQPMGHEFTDSEELDRLTALLKKGLEYHPPNGDEFLLYASMLLDERNRGENNEAAYSEAIVMLEKALIEYKNSKLKSSLLYQKETFYRKLGEGKMALNCLVDIVKLNEKSQTSELAYQDLISYYARTENYPEVLNYTDKFLGIFGNNSDWSCFVLYSKIEACYNLNHFNDLIASGDKYIKLCRNDKETTKTIYGFFADTYNKMGNLELSQRYREMSK